jgi:hypothetical protein
VKPTLQINLIYHIFIKPSSRKILKMASGSFKARRAKFIHANFNRINK